MNVVEKYLENYAEPEAKSLQLASLEPYQTICVVPVYDETLDTLLSFLDLQTDHHYAFVWVLNCPTQSDGEAQKRTQALLKALRTRFPFSDIGHHTSRAKIHAKLDLYLVDRCNFGQEIPAKQGVGLARKIGLDIALRLSYELKQQDHEVSWLQSCDADVSLPEGYIGIAPPEDDQVACIYPFIHRPEQNYEMAMALYDFKLTYYRENLEACQSPYAFYTIGSTIAVTPLAYAQVRGMPKKSGGEDFYFLNKLAKIGRVEQLDQPVLEIAGRPSERVPFGTGPALRDLETLECPISEYQYYHPAIFVALGSIIRTMENMAPNLDWDSFHAQLVIELPEPMLKPTKSVLASLGYEAAYPHIIANTKQHMARFHTWFDGFQTLKFIHGMRQYFPSLNLYELSEHANLLPDILVDEIKALLHTFQGDLVKEDDAS